MNAQTPPRVLVIDDDHRLMAAVATRLRAIGCECLTAASGDEGLRRYSLAAVDLIITDLNMPGVDGIGLIRLIRAASDVPIIIISGCPDDYRGAMGMLHDITLVPKPFDASMLLRRVKSELALSGVWIHPSRVTHNPQRN